MELNSITQYLILIKLYLNKRESYLHKGTISDFEKLFGFYLHPSPIRPFLNKLVEEGILISNKRKTVNKRTFNEYVVDYDKLFELIRNDRIFQITYCLIWESIGAIIFTNSFYNRKDYNKLKQRAERMKELKRLLGKCLKMERKLKKHLNSGTD